jgi:hypothetical protein
MWWGGTLLSRDSAGLDLPADELVSLGVFGEHADREVVEHSGNVVLGLKLRSCDEYESVDAVLRCAGANGDVPWSAEFDRGFAFSGRGAVDVEVIPGPHD